MMAVFALSSCSEDDNTVDEYANWQERNEQAFEDTLAYARQQIAKGSTEWKVIRKWSLQNQTPNKDVTGMDVPLSYKDADHIVVRVLKEGKGSGCPMYTDSVKVSYLGRLLGTDTYPAGYVFDKTFEGTYDKATAQVTTNLASGWIDGLPQPCSRCTSAIIGWCISHISWLMVLPRVRVASSLPIPCFASR